MRILATTFAFLVIAVLIALCNLPEQSSNAQAAEPPQWQAIANATAPKWPAPQKTIKWRTDFKDALVEAKRSKRPLFITIRCLPCKQCSDFDKDVLEGGKLLAPMLKQFVTVRLTSMKDVDERILPYREYQDLDLSWWGYFLSDQAALYGVYGGMDEKGDSSRISPKGLAATMRSLLNHHYHPDRESWGLDREVPKTSGKAETPSTMKGWKSWIKKPAGVQYKKDTECLHCHWVNDVIRQPDIDAKRFDKKKDFFTWAFPENAGFSLDRDKAPIVKSVTKKGAAEKAGLKVGDTIVAAGGARVFSEADLRVALNRIPTKGGKFSLTYLRDKKTKTILIKLSKGWKVTDLGWRKSVNEADVGAHYGFSWPLKAQPHERKKLGVAKDKMAIKPWFGGAQARKLPAAKAGLKRGDFIIEVNGKSANLFGRAFGVWFRMNHEPGDKVKLKVKNLQGKERTIEYKCK